MTLLVIMCASHSSDDNLVVHVCKSIVRISDQFIRRVRNNIYQCFMLQPIIFMISKFRFFFNMLYLHMVGVFFLCECPFSIINWHRGGKQTSGAVLLTTTTCTVKYLL